MIDAPRMSAAFVDTGRRQHLLDWPDSANKRPVEAAIQFTWRQYATSQLDCIHPST
jgi:hypothetical protein